MSSSHTQSMFMDVDECSGQTLSLLSISIRHYFSKRIDNMFKNEFKIHTQKYQNLKNWLKYTLFCIIMIRLLI